MTKVCKDESVGNFILSQFPMKVDASKHVCESKIALAITGHSQNWGKLVSISTKFLKKDPKCQVAYLSTKFEKGIQNAL